MELVGTKVLHLTVDLEEDLAAEFLIVEEMEHKVNNQETQELTDMETLEDQDNIHTTVQAVVEQETVDSRDHQEMVVKVETVETEDQKELQVQQDQAAEAADLGVEHHLVDQVVEEMDQLELVNLDLMLKVVEVQEVGQLNHLLEVVEMAF